jgi:DNA-binding NtrC family response regulator
MTPPDGASFPGLFTSISLFYGFDLNQNSYAPVLLGKRCLVVEDEFLIALDYERILQSAGAQPVFSANSLARAKALLEQHGPVHLVLLDMDLNGESSLPLAHDLIGQGVAVIVITGFNGKLAAAGGLDRVPVLEKPFEERTLLETIKGLMSS